MGNFVKTPSGPGQVVGDTHAADLSGSLTPTVNGHVNSPNSGGANSRSAGIFRSAFGNTNVSQLQSASIVTPNNATNRIFINAVMQTIKITNAGTITIFIRESTTELASSTTGSIAVNGFTAVGVKHTVTNATVANHTYNVATQASTLDQDLCFSDISVACLSIADTHAATLSGSEGTCQ